MKTLAGLLMILLGVTAVTSATPPVTAQNEPLPTLKVATKEIEPFVYFEEGELTGFSIELWEMIATDAGLQTEWVYVEKVSDQLEAILEERADVAIAAISMTADREELIDFSHPYFDAGLHIMTLSTDSSVLAALIDVMLSPRVLFTVLGLALIILLVAHIVWLVERHKNVEDFPKDYLRGVWEGIWWAAVTVTTVGYGDKTPRAFWGRLLGLVWMFVGLFIIANFTATITTQLTVSELQSGIRSIQDLRDRRVATVADSTSAQWMREHRLPFRQVTNIDEAYMMLENGIVEAIVYDSPVLLHHAANSELGKFILVGDVFNLERYGIAMPVNSPYEDAINAALLTIIEDGRYDDLHHKWFATTVFE